MSYITSFISALDSGDWVVAALLGAFALCVIVAKWTRMQAQVEEIPAIKNDIGKMKDDISTIKQDVSKINGRLDIIIANGNIPVGAKSPIQLTDYGHEIFDAIKGEKLVKKYAGKVVFSEGANAYQIQEACRSYTLSEFMDDLDPDERERIELYVYEKGDPIEFPLQVMWVAIRNHWLKKKGIPTTKPKTAKPKKRA